MHVIFVEPAFPRNQREFPRALKSVGAKVTGIGESPIELSCPSPRARNAETVPRFGPAWALET